MWHKLTLPFLTQLPRHNLYFKFLVSAGILALVSTGIWFGGPFLEWSHHAPLAQADKRLYVISVLILLWLLKFLVIDLDAPNPYQYKDLRIQKKLIEMQKRFDGAMHFLNKTTTTKQGKAVRLHQLPWYLLLGPVGAGKTTLLANAGVNFILQKQLPKSNQPLDITTNCDWWITKDASIIDVPGKYLITQEAQATQENKRSIYPVLWKFFLRLVQAQREKNGLGGIIIALPIPEILKQNDTKKYHHLLTELFQHIQDLQALFTQAIPCQLVITKCDLLPGFSEFFAESSDEEIVQAWGVTLPHQKQGEKLYDAFAQRFNALIKRLNQQLLWRLHQERNPMARPQIKDFPFQVERVKELVLDLIKKISATNLPISLQGVYLTSSLQINPEPSNTVLDENLNTTHRGLQIFAEPNPTIRPYFIKQFITHGIINTQLDPVIAKNTQAWKRRLVYGTSLSAIGITALLLGRDFEHGIQQAYTVQNHLSDYQLSIQIALAPNEHLAKTLHLLNTLQDAAKNAKSNINWSEFLSYYSQKSQQTTDEVYHQALRTILLPEIKNYVEEYLKDPVNKNAETLYAALKTYIMLGDAEHFQANFVIDTLQTILAKALPAKDVPQLIGHLSTALNTVWGPLPLDIPLIQDTRRYFISMPSYQLGYIILKNTNDNNNLVAINLGVRTNKTPVFIANNNFNQIPAMFTGQLFSTIMTQDTVIAAQEAIKGNWILGENSNNDNNPQTLAALTDQLRANYVNNYVEVWEKLLNNIRLSSPTDLGQIDIIITDLMSSNSPLLHLLKILHDNTYFEPIITASPKLQNLGLLVDKNNESNNLLYQIFAGLQSFHLYLQNVINSGDMEKAAFDIIANRMQNAGTPDALTQLRIIAEKSPDPVKTWLDKLTNDAWHFLMRDASRYLDNSWQNKVIKVYQSEIANRYPFSNSDREVDVKKFVAFFGNPGTIANFYNDHLRNLVDTSNNEWRWKNLDGGKPPFSEVTLRQLQQAMRIHKAFFPNDDNKLLVQFSLQPYKFGKNIKNVKLNFSDKQFVDMNTNSKAQHVITWSGNNNLKFTSVQMTLMNQKMVNLNYPGNWGWFKLLNQSFESVISKQQFVVNFPANEYSAKYLLYAAGKSNPFASLDLRHFHLPGKITEQRASS